MNEVQKAVARIMFRLKVHECDGQAFENLFVTIMCHHNQHFIPVKPQGSFGDRKNDGYDKTTGTYYQVYAPEDIQKSVRNAVLKLNEDFIGLKDYWDSKYRIERYFFVINDKYKGSSPDIESTLHEIKVNHNLEECRVLLSRDLESILFGLADDIIISVIGFMPSFQPTQQELIANINFPVKFVFGVVKDSINYPPKIDVAGIQWNENFVDVRLHILNTLELDIENIDLFIQLDTSIADIKQITNLPDVFMSPSSQTPIKVVNGVEENGKEIALPVFGRAFSPAYRIYCPKLLSNFGMEFVIASIAINPMLAIEEGQQLFVPKQLPRFINIRGTYTIAELNNLVRFHVRETISFS